MPVGVLFEHQQLSDETTFGLMGAEGVKACKLCRGIDRRAENDGLVSPGSEKSHIGNHDIGFHKIMKKGIRTVRLQCGERSECLHFHERHHLLEHVLQSDASQRIGVYYGHTRLHALHHSIVHICLFLPETLSDVGEVITGGVLVKSLVGGTVFQTAQMLYVGPELDIVEIAFAYRCRHMCPAAIPPHLVLGMVFVDVASQLVHRLGLRVTAHKADASDVVAIFTHKPLNGE